MENKDNVVLLFFSLTFLLFRLDRYQKGSKNRLQKRSIECSFYFFKLLNDFMLYYIPYRKVIFLPLNVILKAKSLKRQRSCFLLISPTKKRTKNTYLFYLVIRFKKPYYMKYFILFIWKMVALWLNQWCILTKRIRSLLSDFFNHLT